MNRLNFTLISKNVTTKTFTIFSTFMHSNIVSSDLFFGVIFSRFCLIASGGGGDHAPPMVPAGRHRHVVALTAHCSPIAAELEK